LVTDQNLEDFRRLAEILLGWVRVEIGDAGKYWGCIGNDEELEKTITEKLNRVRGTYLDDEAYENLFTKLARRMKGGSKLSQQIIESQIDERLNQFVIDCCKRPGPERSTDSEGRPRILWPISFDEEAMARQSMELVRNLSIGLTDDSIKARTSCLRFSFDEAFNLDETISYEVGLNKFIFQFDPKLTPAKAQSSAVEKFGSLLTICKVLYGFDFEMGDLYMIYPFSRGGGVQRLGQTGTVLVNGNARKIKSSLLRSIWTVWAENIAKADGSGTLSAKIKTLYVRQNEAETLLDLITCYEILLAGKTSEIAHKLLIRATTLLNALGIGGTYVIIDQAYEDRSNIVHGSKLLKDLDATRVGDANAKLANWLRPLVVLRVLTGGQTDDFTKKADLLIRNLTDPAGLNKDERAKLTEFEDQVKRTKKLFS
jgi:hypothetical protein